MICPYQGLSCRKSTQGTILAKNRKWKCLLSRRQIIKVYLLFYLESWANGLREGEDLKRVKILKKNYSYFFLRRLLGGLGGLWGEAVQLSSLSEEIIFFYLVY